MPLFSIFHRRPRLLLAFTAGLIIVLLMPHQWAYITRILVGWNVAVWAYLGMMMWLITTTEHYEIQHIAEQEDKGAIAILTVVSITALLSLAAIALELESVKALLPTQRITHYLLTGITVIGSWLLVGMIFTFHYAHSFYLSADDATALQFPDKNTNPNYWDFLYFSFTISVAAQTSDISVMTTSLRKAVTVQSIMSFLFNAAIIGLLINIAAGIIGS